ncbi:hypothetical protein KIW84_040137 [Lathyrus oleraceus]|uniref:Uncharacterized protein n=1 Tax=Pisum sativum TaxID=3888 RepID=A0A9D4X6I6_PEA|nr:hypothetical protein KIW84_040137 [Pisum sativum]
MRYGDIKSKMLEVAKPLVNKFQYLWWRDLKLTGVVEADDYNWFANNISCKIGNGSTIEFWRNSWLGYPSLDRLFPLIFARVVDQKLKVLNMGEWVDNKADGSETLKALETRLLHPLTPSEAAALEDRLFQPLTPSEADDSEAIKASKFSDP